MRRLPPFLSLRSLEAAVRHRSYSGAAGELNVTHGAVSHQIRKLEAEFGVTLFHRQGNAMAPTPEAQRLAGRIAKALDLLRIGVDEIGAAAAADPLVISTVPAFASRWLTPRLHALTQATGEAHVELRVSDGLADFVTDGVDVGLRQGPGNWPGLEQHRLFGETLFPVCSPDFLRRHPLETPSDLLGVTLLRWTFRPWSRWFEALGVEEGPSQSGLIFDDSALMLDAAMQGVGVALARSGLAEPDLRAGRLVRPFAHEIDHDWAYFIVWRADSRKLRRIGRLRDWLIAEVAREGFAG